MLTADMLAPPGSRLRDLLTDGLRVGIGVVWLFAGTQKLRSPKATFDTVARLLGGPAGVTRAVTRVVSPAEIVLGMILVVGWQARMAALLSAFAFVLFAFLVGRATIRDALPEGGCGCFGPSPVTEVNDAGPRAIARNLVLAMLAVAAAA